MNHQPKVGDGGVKGWLSLILHFRADFSPLCCLSSGGCIPGGPGLGTMPSCMCYSGQHEPELSYATASIAPNPMHISRLAVTYLVTHTALWANSLPRS